MVQTSRHVLMFHPSGYPLMNAFTECDAYRPLADHIGWRGRRGMVTGGIPGREATGAGGRGALGVPGISSARPVSPDPYATNITLATEDGGDWLCLVSRDGNEGGR